MIGPLAAFIGLGANVGDPQAALERAVAALRELPGAALAGVSRLYRTRPVGPVEQADFLNAVVSLGLPPSADPERAAVHLLEQLKDIERGLGRQPRERWGPREVDLDLLLFGDHVVRVERPPDARSDDPARVGAQWLEVPHPAARERLFVLAPLADLAPGVEPPGWGISVERARDGAALREGPGAVTPVARWDERRRRWVAPA